MRIVFVGASDLSLENASLLIDRKTQGRSSELDLPGQARVIYLYPADKFMLADAETELRPDDEGIILTHSKHLADLTERFHEKGNEAGSENEQQE